MTLSALIRKRSTVAVATAIRAISAIPEGVTAGTVARIATIAVANPTEGKAAILPTLRGADFPEPVNDHQSEIGSYLELDMLIMKYAALSAMPAERVDELLCARWRMSPAQLQGDIEQFKQWIAERESCAADSVEQVRDKQSEI